MSAKRIMLVESGQFIGGVMQHLFAQQAGSSVIEVFPSSAQEMIAAVEQHQPDVVVLDDTVGPEYLTMLLDALKGGGNLSVIQVSTSSNDVMLYRKQQINVQRKADLFAAL